MPKIVRFHEVGGPEKLVTEESPSSIPGVGEVRLRVEATGLNRAEAMFLRGSYFEKPNLPSRIGVECAGIVEAVGEGVSQQLIGKHVATLSGFSQSRYGVLGEEAVVPAIAVAQYAENLTPEQGAASSISYLTAWGALIHSAKIGPGDFVIVPAASSSVGLAAIQIIKDAGAVAIATTRSAEKRQELFGLGADVVVATEEEDLPARVREITKGHGVGIIFDAVGGPYIATLAEAVAQGGTIYLYGGLSGKPTEYPLATGISKALSLRGYSMGEVRATADVLAEGTRYVRERLLDGRFVPKIAKTFTLEQAADAYRFLESNQQVGKVVITT